MWQEVADTRAGKVRVVTVAMDAQGAGRARPFVEAAGVTLDALVDRQGQLWDRFDFGVVPLQLYFDETGRLLHRSTGAPRGEVLVVLDEALARPRAAPEAASLPHEHAPASPASGEAAALFARGVAALDRGDAPRASSLWQQALQKEPDNWLIRKQLWTLEAPEAFWGPGDIDFEWQRRRLAKDGDR